MFETNNCHRTPAKLVLLPDQETLNLERKSSVKYHCAFMWLSRGKLRTREKILAWMTAVLATREVLFRELVLRFLPSSWGVAAPHWGSYGICDVDLLRIRRMQHVSRYYTSSDYLNWLFVAFIMISLKCKLKFARFLKFNNPIRKGNAAFQNVKHLKCPFHCLTSFSQFALICTESQHKLSLRSTDWSAEFYFE